MSEVKLNLILTIILVILLIFPAQIQNVTGEARRSFRITPISCEDTEDDIDYFTKGTVAYEYSWWGRTRTRTYPDRCRKNRLYEYYCKDNKLKTKRYECSNGCSNGACISEASIPKAKKKAISPREITTQIFQEENTLLYKSQTGDTRIIDTKAMRSFQEISSGKLTVSVVEPKFDGYIVQFKKDPELKERSRLKEKGLTKQEIKAGVEAHRNKILEEHNKAIQDIKSRVPAITSFAVRDTNPRIKTKFTKTFNGIVVDVSPKELKEIKKSRYVKEVFLNYKVNITLMDSVPLINADDVWLLDQDKNTCATSGKDCLTGKGITIAVIDTGIDYTHPDLGGCLGPTCKVIGGYDFINYDEDPMDDHGHGTHCAGIAAGEVLRGVAPDADILAYKVLSAGGSGTMGGVIAGIERAVDPNQDGDFSDHADIISMSLGGYGHPDDPASQAVDNAAANGVIVVVAAGNSGPWEQTIGSPGTARKAITVGASDKTDNIAYFSSRGPVIWQNGIIIKPDIVAPGVSICAAQWNDAWSYRECLDTEHTAISGTSMATPHVAGAAALLLQKNPNWTPNEIKMALRNTAKNIGEEIIVQGYGRINILKAIQFIGVPSIAELSTSGKVDGIIAIIGTAVGKEFSNYALYYGKGENPNIWEEITNSNVPVVNGVLYISFDTSLLDEGYNQFKLLVWNADGVKSEDRTIIFVLRGLQKGWPQSTNRAVVSSPVCGDIDNDGYDEVIIGSVDGKVYAWHHNGIPVQGWPVELGHYVKSSPALADINKNGYKEIIIGSDFNWNIFPHSYIYILDKNGKNIDGWPQLIEGASGFSSVVIEDIDNDGDFEIIAAESGTHSIGIHCDLDEDCPECDPYGYDLCGFQCLYGQCMHVSKNIYVWNHDGTLVNGWPFKADGQILSTPAVGDVNNDGSLEIVFGSGLSGSTGGYLYILNKDGNPLDGWPIKVSDEEVPFIISPILVDINTNGFLEIFITASPGNFYAFNYNGSYLTGWPKPYIAASYSSAIADLDFDGNYEVVFGTFDSKVYAVHANGEPLDGWPVQLQGMIVDAPPAIGDIDNDGLQEVLISGYGSTYLYAFNHDGSQVEGFPKFMEEASWSGSAICDLDKDGDIEIVIGGSRANNVYVWDLDATYDPLKMEWPTFHHDIQRTGYYKPVYYKPVECTDSDGKNYYIKGSTIGVIAWYDPILENVKTKEDYCTTICEGAISTGKADSGPCLVEYYCTSHPKQGGPPVYAGYDVKTCEYGCQDGACLKEELCKDTDAGKNYYVKGYVDEPKRGITWDVCGANGLLYERYCTNNPEELLGSHGYRCEDEGLVCKDGSCVQSAASQEQCTALAEITFRTCTMGCLSKTATVKTVCIAACVALKTQTYEDCMSSPTSPVPKLTS